MVSDPVGAKLVEAITPLRGWPSRRAAGVGVLSAPRWFDGDGELAATAPLVSDSAGGRAGERERLVSVAGSARSTLLLIVVAHRNAAAVYRHAQMTIPVRKAELIAAGSR